MKHAVKDLEGALLDAAVAKALGMRSAEDCFDVPFDHGPSDDQMFGDAFEPSTRWGHGGPFLERQRIDRIEVERIEGAGPHEWAATVVRSTGAVGFAEGPTQLIALVRACLVAEFGDTVELP